MSSRSDAYDVIVIGGGPAGATCASYMAMHGHSVLLLEKSKFPRYRLGESLLPSMMPILEDFGLIEKMEALEFPHKTGGSFSWGKDDEPWSVIFAENPFLPYQYAYHVDRGVFDAVLLDHARDVGVEVIVGGIARGPLVDSSGRVVGVSAKFPGERTSREIRSRFVVDGSGPASVIGKQLTTRTYDDRMQQTSLHTYYQGVAGEPAGQEGHVIVTSCPRGWFWYIPMNSGELGEASVGLVTGQEFRDEIARVGNQAFYDAALAECPRLQAMLGPKAEQMGRMRSIRDWAFACDRMAGPGFFLAGDSAAFVDPLLSTGVSLAMLAGYSAAVCMHTVLRDPSMEGDAIRFYDGNYKRMYSVTRDCLLYFYSGNVVHSEDVFWKARKLMRFGDNAGAKQAFSFLVNTVAANPHPAARKQIHMFAQFMDKLSHPDPEEMVEEEEIAALQERAPAEGEVAAIRPGVKVQVNGYLSTTCVIDDEAFELRRVRGIAYDDERPVFSSTASWLLGRNFAPLEGLALQLVDLLDSGWSWAEAVDLVAEQHGLLGGPGASEQLMPILNRLRDERLVVLRQPA